MVLESLQTDSVVLEQLRNGIKLSCHAGKLNAESKGAEFAWRVYEFLIVQTEEKVSFCEDHPKGGWRAVARAHRQVKRHFLTEMNRTGEICIHDNHYSTILDTRIRSVIQAYEQMFSRFFSQHKDREAHKIAIKLANTYQGTSAFLKLAIRCSLNGRSDSAANFLDQIKHFDAEHTRYVCATLGITTLESVIALMKNDALRATIREGLCLLQKEDNALIEKIENCLKQDPSEALQLIPQLNILENRNAQFLAVIQCFEKKGEYLLAFAIIDKLEGRAAEGLKDAERVRIIKELIKSNNKEWAKELTHLIWDIRLRNQFQKVLNV